MQYVSQDKKKSKWYQKMFEGINNKHEKYTISLTIRDN